MTTKTNIIFSINRLFFDSKAKESYYCPAKFIIAKPKSQLTISIIVTAIDASAGE